MTEHAIRAAGGLAWLERCPESELQWVRKRFIESYTRVHETDQVKHMLTRGEARKILAKPTAAPKEPAQKRLIGAAEDQSAGDRPDSEEVRVALHEIVSPKEPPAQPLGQEEWERRRSEQLRRFYAAHPELSPVARTEA